MAGNSFGKLLTLTTFGESHGESIGGILDGVPSGIDLDISDIQPFLNRRRPGHSDVTSPRKEEDLISILSGVFEGKTTGTPIGFLIQNSNTRSKDYDNLKDTFRPGHADLTYQLKYGIRDHRGGGRSSGRETALRVAAGAIARKILPSSTKIIASVIQIGNIKTKNWNDDYVYNNPFFTADKDSINSFENIIKEAIDDGTSIGAMIELRVYNPPIGLGEPVYDKLSADIAKAIFSIGAVKGLEIGEGFNSIGMKGHEHNDMAFTTDNNELKFKTNHAGGILGGISNGDTIVLRIAVKPTSSVSKTQDTIDKNSNNTTISTIGRHDPCVGIRIAPVSEAMVALTLADHYLRYKATAFKLS